MCYLFDLVGESVLDGVFESAPLVLVVYEPYVLYEWVAVVLSYIYKEHESFVIDFHPVLDGGDFQVFLVWEVHGYLTASMRE